MRFVCAGTRYKVENNKCAKIERMSMNSLSRLLKGFRIGNSPGSFSPGNRYGKNLASYAGTQNKTKRATYAKKAKKAKRKSSTRRAKTVKGLGMNVERTQKRAKTQKKREGLLTLPSTANISSYLASGYKVERELRGKIMLKPPPAATALSRRSSRRRNKGTSRAQNRINRARAELMFKYRSKMYPKK